MVAKLKTWWQGLSASDICLLAFIISVIVSVWTAAISGYYFLVGMPAVLLVVFVALVDFRHIYWLLLAMVPFSTEIVLPNGLGTDLPTEPLMVGLMLIFGIYALSRLSRLSFDSLRHPVTIALLVHLGWLLVTTVMSDLLFVSVKFLLAKLWYVVAFFFVTLYLVRSTTDFKRFFWIFFWPFLIVLLIILGRHALSGFSFMDIHSVMHPFHRNHVNYAASLALFYPFIILMIPNLRKGHWQRWLLGGVALLLLIAIYFSFTRAAYVALFIALGSYYIIRWRLMKPALILSVLIALGAVVHMVTDNTYLDYAPNFERTVSHERFDNLIEATYKMEDISTMERVYRWVAAGHMTPERPILGWGPGNFVNFYKTFTVTSFQTYVSDNPEQSGLHSYFFMTLVEQGLLGLVFFMAILFAFFIRGEQLYHALAAYPERQRILLAAMLSMIIITAFLLINDLVETDKIGSFFFINLALLVRQDLFIQRVRKENKMS